MAANHGDILIHWKYRENKRTYHALREASYVRVSLSMWNIHIFTSAASSDRYIKRRNGRLRQSSNLEETRHCNDRQKTTKPFPASGNAQQTLKTQSGKTGTIINFITVNTHSEKEQHSRENKAAWAMNIEIARDWPDGYTIAQGGRWTLSKLLDVVRSRMNCLKINHKNVKMLWTYCSKGQASSLGGYSTWV